MNQKMVKTLSTILLFFSLKLTAQKPYFQQQVNYKIVASLDDKKHILTGTIEIDYQNNAPDPLSMLYILLPANAYKSKTSAFAKQTLRRGSTDFYFAESAAMGGFSNLNFEADGRKVELEFEPKNTDVAKVKLPAPIPTGGRVKITTPFTYRIPFPFSRGGHAKQQYLMTQWYPRPAVYDRDGWHPQPYLDQGEFYQEFGNFDVSLSLPENYVVGATGVLETPAEQQFIAEKARYTEGVLKMDNSGAQLSRTQRDSILKAQFSKTERDSFPPSSEKMKTIRYTAEKVVDFAWFADKRFLVLASETTLQRSGRQVKSYAYFPPRYARTWWQSTAYINRAVNFYSDLVGDYPHPQASAVMADEGFGGGMEYPMITVLSGYFSPRALDGTITHEVGHNWFQGILASNERDHPWLDEGLNSYYDHRYDATFYGENTEGVGLPAFLTKGSDYTYQTLAPMLFSQMRRDQAPATHSDSLTSTNYGLAVYEKTAQALQILERHVGRDKFDALMQAYYTAWQFKHPQPADFRKIWESDPDVGDVSWLFDGLIGSSKPLDYKIEKIEESNEHWKVTIKNKGKIAAPFTVSALRKDSAVWTSRLSGIAAGETTVAILPKTSQADMISVDYRQLLTDVNRQNNHIKTAGLFRKIEPLRLSFLPRFDHSRRTNLYITPIAGLNAYDKVMVGAWLSNGLLPFKKLSWSLAPMYSFGAKSWAGLGAIDYSFFVNRTKLTLGLGVRRFSFDANEKFSTITIYEKYTPSVSIAFGTHPTSAYRHSLQFRPIFLRQQGLVFDSTGQYLGKRFENNRITELAYTGSVRNVLGNTSFRLAIENQGYDYLDTSRQYWRLGLSLNQDFMYQQGKRIYARLYVGGFLKNIGRDAGSFFGARSRASLGLASRGLTDYRYDHLWLGRRDEKGLLSQQIDPNTEGGMKFTLPEGNPFEVGFSNSMIASLNLSFDLPVSLPRFLKIKPYFDLGYFQDTRPESLRANANKLASGGIQWQPFGDVLNIYVPLYFSGKPLEEDPNSFRAYMSKNGDFFQRITFSLDLKSLNPKTLIHRLLD
jgi:hypothetical protein